MVNVNGTIIGLTRYPMRFVTNFRRLRRAGRFSEFVGIFVNHHHHAVHIASDGGRICRPMIIVENGRPRVTSEHITVKLLHIFDGQRGFDIVLYFSNSSKAMHHLTTSSETVS